MTAIKRILIINHESARYIFNAVGQSFCSLFHHLIYVYFKLTSLSQDNEAEYKYPSQPMHIVTKILPPHNASTGSSRKCDPTPQSIHSYGLLATHLCKNNNYS